jgi:hypothetical protein
MKFSWVISWVRWFSFVEIIVLKIISVLVLRVVEIICVRWTTQSFYLYLSKLRSQGYPLAMESFPSGHCSLCLVQPSGWLASSLLETRLGSEDRDGLRNVGLCKTEPPHLADNPRKLHYTHSPGKHQIMYNTCHLVVLTFLKFHSSSLPFLGSCRCSVGLACLFPVSLILKVINFLSRKLCS